VFKHTVIVLTLALLAVPAGAQSTKQGKAASPTQGAGRRGPRRPAPPTYDYGWKSEEYLLLGNANRGAGEPMIAVDPTNPKNIIVLAMASLQQVPKNGPARTSIGRSTITSMAVTHDGGFTWKFGELPILYNDTLRCPDPFVDVTKDGTFIAGCEIRQTRPGGTEGSYVMISRDKGDTWGPRAEVIGWNTQRFAPGLRPHVGGAAPYDRPFLAIDDSSGVIYGVAQGGSAEGASGKTKQQAYITASTNGGKSFGTIYAWDSNSGEYPQTGRGLGQAAAFGEVGLIYMASSVPASEKATCPCPIFGVSRDLGKTFTYHIVTSVPHGTLQDAGPYPASLVPSVMAGVAADPTKQGHWAILSYIAGKEPRYEVVTSEDNGQTWSAPVDAGATPNAVSSSKPAFRFSRQGVLGLMWRAIYRDGTYDIWSAISKDGGKTFSEPLRVSHAVSPARDPIRVGANDDFQDLSVDGDNVYMVWCDYRAGFQGTFFGSVPFSAYEFAK
jgi:hypothetical protein